MSKNDTILLDSLIDQRLDASLPTNRRDEVFEYFALEQALKDYDLSPEELTACWVDGTNDGGIDGMAVFINGQLLTDIETLGWPKRNAEIIIHILTCKHHETFLQAPLDLLVASISELLDLAIPRTALTDKYSEDILNCRELINTAYRRLSITRPTIELRYSYASRGDSAKVGDSVQARADQLVTLTRDLFSSAKASFTFLGAEELVQLHRRIKRFSLDLPVVEHFSTEPTGYVVLSRLDDYCRFITDESGQLRRYLFESNVRDFLGDSAVNEEIQLTLRTTRTPDFWWLNNGVTILATAATTVGKVLQLEDIQIVNGLQTTQALFRCFKDHTLQQPQRTILVKVIVSTDAAVRDAIIRATNNQNIVEVASLRATDKIQRDIEDMLEKHNWFYERRKNYYRNIGKPATRFVTPLYIASGYVALVQKRPQEAASLKSRFMRNDDSYKRIFSSSIPIELWPKIVAILKKCEDGLLHARQGERFLANWRNLVAFLAVARSLNTFDFTIGALLAFDANSLTTEDIRATWSHLERTPPPRSKVKGGFKDKDYIERATKTWAEEHSIAGLPTIFREVSRDTFHDQQEFIELVNATLTDQPWRPGEHIRVANALGVQPKKVGKAIKTLMESGRRHHQRDGVVYASDGSILAVDPTRATSGGSTLR